MDPLTIIGGVAIVAVIAFIVYRQKNKADRPTPTPAPRSGGKGKGGGNR